MILSLINVGRPLQREAIGAFLIVGALLVWVGGWAQILPGGWRGPLAKVLLAAGAVLAVSALV